MTDFNIIQKSRSKMNKMLEIWIRMESGANIEKLLRNLKEIDRFDVYNDVINSIGLSQ